MRLRALDRGVALGFGGGDVGVALDARDVGPAHVGDVLVLVADFLDGERDDLEAHLVHVVGAGGAHAVADHLRLLHDLFHRELADDAAQVAFHHQPDQAFALLRRSWSGTARPRSGSTPGSDLTLICATASTVTATPCLV